MRFQYVQAMNVEEAISLLARYKGEAKIIAGGTDLVVQMRQKAVTPAYLVDIGGIKELDYVDSDEKGGLRIGSLTTIRALEKSDKLRERYPVISQAAGKLGSVAIRNMGTIGGNLCNAAPSAETAPALIGLSAKAVIAGPEGRRIVPLEDFFTGPGSTLLKPEELLIEIQVPTPLPGTRGVYLKHAVRGTVDLAIVGVATIVTIDPRTNHCRDVKIVLGAVAPTPMRARKAEEIVKGKAVKDDLIQESAKAASDESRPISDVRASTEYRREMVKVLTRCALREAIAK